MEAVKLNFLKYNDILSIFVSATAFIFIAFLHFIFAFSIVTLFFTLESFNSILYFKVTFLISFTLLSFFAIPSTSIFPTFIFSVFLQINRITLISLQKSNMVKILKLED